MTNSEVPAMQDAREEQAPLLEVRDAVVHYGRIEALHGVSLVVRQGSW